MRKILYLLILLPFGLFGQNDFVRHIVTADGEVTFWRGTQQLWVSSITSPPVYEATYYVAPWGDDDNPGTFEEPWQSWQKGFYQPNHGDTVYFRGGEYDIVNPGSATSVVSLYNDNASTDTLNLWAYPGEVPVLNCNSDGTYQRGISLTGSKYIHMRGLNVKNVMQKTDGSTYGRGFYFRSCDSIWAENCTAYSCQGPGFSAVDNEGTAGYISHVNCDSYNNYDPYTTTPNSPGGNADGFLVYGTNEDAIITYNGCRSWYNSDDGFDTYGTDALVSYDSCWTFNNGRDEGNGNGFKMGPSDTYVDLRREYNNCISANNIRIGFDGNGIDGIMHIYNNISYSNTSAGYITSGGNPDIAHIFRNNTDYDNGAASGFGSNNIHDHNSWDSDPAVEVTDADFVSLDVNQLDNPRQADGSLPIITCFHLAEGSDLIDAGVDVGIAYEGEDPDIGAFESNY